MNASQTAIEIPTITQVSGRRRAPRWVVIVLVCLFAGLIPETILTSSTSVAALIVGPFSLVFLAIFYGTAMLIVREAIIRKAASWLSVLLLCVAFGFCNEGVVAGTWYTVKNSGYLFFGSVDVAWAVGLTVFHIFISMIMTVAFTDVLFPSYVGQSLLGRRGMRIAAALFIFSTSLAFFASTFRLERVIVFGVALLLAVIALRLPPAQPRPLAVSAPPRLWLLRLFGFAAYLLYFILLYFIPVVIARLPHMSLTQAQFIDMASMVGFTALVFVLGVGWLRTMGWGPRQNLALITGTVAFMTLLSVLVPSQVVILEPAATVPFFIFLLWRAGQLKRREAAMSASERREGEHE